MIRSIFAAALFAASLVSMPALAEDKQDAKPAEQTQAASGGQSDYCKGWKKQIDDRIKACEGSVKQECKTLKDEKFAWELQCE
ncbi:MAG: hypothetical protein H6883_09320 [Rhodobiaceae bacterium]|nr:hypothetical protein [Rhodobiaceae bacterium]MCC0056326.1 hypothetical protein [Rhodobiaceae bacterium]